MGRQNMINKLKAKMNKAKMPSSIPTLPVKMDLKGNQNDIFGPVPKSMIYQQGELFLDDEHIANSQVYNRNKVVWSKRNESKDCWEHGAFTFHPSGLYGVCVLVKSKDFDCKQVISSTLLNGSLPPVVYNMKKNVDPEPKDPDNKTKVGDEESIDFGTLSTYIDISGEEPTVKLLFHVHVWVINTNFDCGFFS